MLIKHKSKQRFQQENHNANANQNANEEKRAQKTRHKVDNGVNKALHVMASLQGTTGTKSVPPYAPTARSTQSQLETSGNLNIETDTFTSRHFVGVNTNMNIDRFVKT